MSMMEDREQPMSGLDSVLALRLSMKAKEALALIQSETGQSEQDVMDDILSWFSALSLTDQKEVLVIARAMQEGISLEPFVKHTDPE